MSENVKPKIKFGYARFIDICRQKSFSLIS